MPPEPSNGSLNNCHDCDIYKKSPIYLMSMRKNMRKEYIDKQWGKEMNDLLIEVDIHAPRSIKFFIMHCIKDLMNIFKDIKKNRARQISDN